MGTPKSGKNDNAMSKLPKLHEMKKAGFKTNKGSVKYKNGDFIIAERGKETREYTDIRNKEM